MIDKQTVLEAMVCCCLPSFSVPSKAESARAVAYKPQFKQARVVSVYDGDTLTLTVKKWHPFRCRIFSYKARIYGIDCPELRSKNEEERKAAVYARDKVTSLVQDKVVDVNVRGYDKYGRVLCDIKQGKTSIAEMLLSMGLAVPYFGKTKQEIDWFDHIQKTDNVVFLHLTGKDTQMLA